MPMQALPTDEKPVPVGPMSSVAMVGGSFQAAAPIQQLNPMTAID
jgi:hypothetical protein